MIKPDLRIEPLPTRTLPTNSPHFPVHSAEAQLMQVTFDSRDVAPCWVYTNSLLNGFKVTSPGPRAEWNLWHDLDQR